MAFILTFGHASPDDFLQIPGRNYDTMQQERQTLPL